MKIFTIDTDYNSELSVIFYHFFIGVSIEIESMSNQKKWN